MKQWNRGTLAGFGALIVVVGMCLAMVTSTVTVAGLSGRSSGSLFKGAPTAVTPLDGPTCTVIVPAENASNDALQNAINDSGPGATICIGPGTFPEQLTISTPGLTLIGSGNSSTIIAPTAVASHGQFDWDSASRVGVAPTVPMFAIILVENSSGWVATTGVTVEDLEVDGGPASSSVTCGDDYVGVDFQDASGTLTGATVANVASPSTSFGCQEVSGAIYAYNAHFYTGVTPSPAIAVTVSDSTVLGYQKNGVTCDDLGETCTVSGNTVTGVGPTTLNAQNGVQVGFGASAVVSDNFVSGNHYLGSTGTQPGTVSYFAPGVWTASGILAVLAGNSVQITGNVLSGNDLAIALIGTPTSVVSDNTVTQGYGYGITFDLNTSFAYLQSSLYSTATPWLSTASGNSIENVNVGILSYDDNVTITGGSMSNVNVSIEAVTDHAGSSYATVVDGVSAVVNVSGALLGNISSFQTLGTLDPTSVGSYSLYQDSFIANPVLSGAGAGDGILINGTTALVNACQVSGFSVAIYVNPTVASATIEASTVTSTAALGMPVTGIWAGNFVYPTTLDSGTFLIKGNTVTGPGGGANSPVAGGTGIIAGGASVTITGNTVSGYSAILSSPGGNGNDWWEGTQSVGVLVGCPATTAASACAVEGNTITNNTIGIVDLLTNLTFSTAYETGPVTITYNQINESGGYGIFTEMDWYGPAAPPTSYIEYNTFNDTLSGAPAMVLSGQGFEVTHNVMIGTSATGDQGPVQGLGGPSIATASVEATDYWTTGTDTVTLNANLFLDTTLYWSTAFSSGSASTLSGGNLVTFSESGLPAGVPWSMTIDGTSGTTTAPGPIVADLQVNYGLSPYSFSVGAVAGYGPSPLSGKITVYGAGIFETITFSATKYTVTFMESGLARGSAWWLYLSTGQSFSSRTGSISFQEVSGNYSYSLGITYQRPKDYSAPSSWFVVNGAPVVQPVGFVPVRAMEVDERGLPTHTLWWVNLTIVQSAYASGTSFSTKGTSLTLYLGSGVYVFAFASSNKSYALGALHFSVGPAATISPRLFSAPFHLVVYAVTFSETTLPAGTTWCVSVHGGAHCSRGRTVTFNEPNGTYQYTVTSANKVYAAAGGSFTVNGPVVPQSVTFALVTYTVTFMETGLPSEASWSVVLGGVTHSSTGTVITFNEPNGTYAYSVSTTVGGYTAAGGKLTVKGPPPPVSKTVVFSYT